MKRLYFIFFLLIILLITLKFPSYAIYDPLSVPNNKFGIHIIDENDLDNAATLVNSTGGDWGYITMVITKNDQNINKWQNIFTRMKELHLIPLIRLATKLHNQVWEKPTLQEVPVWAEFLNSLNWPVKN